ncbi:MAG: aminodeoxychorismate lyase [Pseudomonadota bacterium]
MSEWFQHGVRIAALPVDDRAWLYGDGVFETIAVRGGTPRQCSWHLERLTLGCRRLGIGNLRVQELEHELDAALAATAVDTERALTRLVVTAGRSPRGYGRPAGSRAGIFVGVFDWQPPASVLYREGCTVRICNTRLARQPQLAGIKTLNRLEQVLARAEWASPEVFEGLTFDTDGHLICGTMSNVFIVHERQLMTPDLSQAGVAGIMRRCILQTLQEQGAAVAITEIGVDLLAEATEVFICNSQFGVMPVAEIGGVADAAVVQEQGGIATSGLRKLSVGAMTQSLMRDLSSQGYPEIAC